MYSPANLMLMVKVIIMVSDIGTELDPSFNFDRQIRPYIAEISAQQRFSVETLVDTAQAVRDAAESLIAMPHNVNETLRSISEGAVSIEIEKNSLQRIVGSLDRTSDKIVIGLVTAAIVVGSSLVLRVVDVQLPRYVSVLATIGYVGAVIVGFYAIYNVVVHGRRLQP